MSRKVTVAMFFIKISIIMVTYPKTRNTLCPKCKTHRLHKVTQYKKGKESTFAQGRRRYDMKQKGFGGQKKPIQKRKAKVNKKVTLRLECPIDKTRRLWCIGRVKSFKFEDKKKA